MNSRIYSYEQLLQLGFTGALHQGFKKSALFLWFLCIGIWGELRAQPLSTQTQGGIPGPPSLPQPPHPLLGELQGALGHISSSQKQENKHVTSPSTPASYTQPSWEGMGETGCHHGIPSWLPGPRVVSTLLRDCQPNYTPPPPAHHVTGHTPFSQETKSMSDLIPGLSVSLWVRCKTERQPWLKANARRKMLLCFAAIG